MPPLNRRTFLTTLALAAAAGGRSVVQARNPELELNELELSFDEQPGAPRVSRAFSGLSYEKQQLTRPYFTVDNQPLVSLFGLLGRSVLRLGGNSVDLTSWKGVQPGLTPLTPEQVDACAAFVARVGWRVIWGLNLARSTPATAAAEAAHVSASLGDSLLAFEIGNEPDVYRSNGLRPTTYAFSDFLAEWRAVAGAVQARVPGAPLSGPASADDAARYTTPFLAAEADQIQLLTQHYYRANGRSPSATLEELLTPDTRLSSQTNQLAAAARAQGVSDGYRLAEANSFSNGGAPGISDSFGAALWAVDFLFQSALAGASGVNFHGGGAGPGYTPIADQGGAVVEVRPVFYGLKLFAEAARGRVSLGSTSPADPALRSYAVKRAGGRPRIVVINLNPTTRALVCRVSGRQVWSALALSAPSLQATEGVTLGGAAIGADGSWQPVAAPLRAHQGWLHFTVAPTSAVVLRPGHRGWSSGV